MALNDAVPSSATDVFKRNAEDVDRLLNSAGDITTRTGKILPSWDEITQSHAAWNNRGAWTTATAYAVNDIWEDGGVWYVVLTPYTSGATAAADIAGPNVAVLNGNFGSAATKDTGTDFDQIPLNADIVYPVDKVITLRVTEPTQDGQQIDLLGHTNPGIGGGQFWYDATDTSSADNNGTVIVTTSGKRWKRRVNGFVTPQMFGIEGVEGVDATSVIQYMFDNFADIYFPAGTYSIATTLQHRRNNNPTIRGPKGDRSLATIKTLPAFVGRRMFCNWDLSWYTEGDDINIPPPKALMNGVHNNDWSRYVNLTNVQFNIDTPTVETELISCVDIAEAHEGADFHGLIFNASSDFQKGSTFRLFGSQGGWEISHVTCYSENWEHQFYANVTQESIADIIIKRWLTSTRPGAKSPFEFTGGWGKVSLYDIHMETSALDGSASFNTESRSFTIDGLWKTYTPLETGVLVKMRNPNGNGFGSSSPVLKDLRLTGSTNVDVDIMDSSSQSASFAVVIPRRAFSGQQIAYVEYLSELMFRGSDGNGRRVFDIDKAYQSFGAVQIGETMRITAVALKNRLVNINFATLPSGAPDKSDSGRIVLAEVNANQDNYIYQDDGTPIFTISAWDRTAGTLDLLYSGIGTRNIFSIFPCVNDDLRVTPVLV